MANDSKSGKRLPSGQSAPYTAPSDGFDFSLDETITFAGLGTDRAPHSTVDDAVVDEILRSISDQSDTPVPNTPVRPARSPQSGPAVQQTRPSQPRAVPGNSYAAAAARHHQEERTQPVSRSTGPIPDPSYYAMRDPSHTQSFQPARPAHRDTDRLPTLVEEKPVRRKSAVGKVLTFLVAILVIVALVLGVRMAYLLGPSLGWNLPDLTKLPGISTLTGMLPEEDSGDPTGETPLDSTESQDPESVLPNPTAITLDQETLTLDGGGIAILTATTDVEGWTGTMVWQSSDEAIATVTSIGDNIAQVEYVGEGKCSIAVVAALSAQGDNPTAYCHVICNAPGEDTGEDQPAEPTEPDTTAQHVDIQLNREDFTLKVGERHTLMDENADQVTWTSSDESVATVGETGIVTAVGAGTATITATGPDGATASAICRVK